MRRLVLLPLVLCLAALTFSQTPLVHGIGLKWAASVTTGISGQNVYRGTTTGGPYTKLTATPLPATALTYEDPVTDGKTYFYVVTVLSAGPVILESVNSNEASATAPGPVPNPQTGLAASPN